MNASQRLDMLLSDLLHNDRSSSNNGIVQDKTIEPLSKLTLTGSDFCPKDNLNATILSPVTSLIPRRDPSALKIHRRYPAPSQNESNSKPLLNSSTLDDLFRALTLECEQYLAASCVLPEKAKIESTNERENVVESNDEDYENLHGQSLIEAKIVSPLKTSIEVISPVKRHIVSISISSKVSTGVNVKTATISTTPPVTTIPTETTTTTTTTTTNSTGKNENLLEKSLPTVVEPVNSRSSEENPDKFSPSNNNRRRRRRTRKRMISSTTTRSSSSSNERKETVTEKKIVHPRRSCSTDYRHQRGRDPYENHSSVVSQKQIARRGQRRDVSLQNSSSNKTRYHEEHSPKLSVLLTSSKSTSDFLDQKPEPSTRNKNQQQRRSRLEYLFQKPATLLDRMHQQLYRSASSHNSPNSIPTHRMSSYRVY